MLYVNKKNVNTLNWKTESPSKKTIKIAIAKVQIRSAFFSPKEIRNCIIGPSELGHKSTEELGR